MFKTKVLNKHLALALTSGLLLMANAVNAESYTIGSITPNSDEILKGNNVVVTQDTTGNPVFFTPSKDAYNVNFQRFPTLDAKKLVNAPKMSAHHRGICHF